MNLLYSDPCYCQLLVLSRHVVGGRSYHVHQIAVFDPPTFIHMH